MHIFSNIYISALVANSNFALTVCANDSAVTDGNDDDITSYALATEHWKTDGGVGRPSEVVYAKLFWSESTGVGSLEI